MGNSSEHPASGNSAVDEPLTLGDEQMFYLGASRRGCTFDRSLASQHSYLGNDLEVLRGRTFLDDELYHKLHLLEPNGVILIPGQTLPLTIFDPGTIRMLQQCIAQDRTFGVVCKCYSNAVGTTAEIYAYQNEGGVNGFRVKAKARQRFKVIKSENAYNGKTATVKILPEVCLPDSLEAVRFQSLYRHRTSYPLRCRKRDAMVTVWPEWVYRQYDAKRLVATVKRKLSFLEDDPLKKNKLNIPDDPTELSFWLAQNIPVSNEQLLFLLKLNSPIQRLRWELSVLHKFHLLLCNKCRTALGSLRDTFSMSVEGPQGTYVNPGGHVHETVTLYTVKDVITSGPPSSDFSWFPGYEWSIAMCRQCYKHVGWKFTTKDRNLKPKQFWGLCRSSLCIDNIGDTENDNFLM